jgi:uncharacterized repeat protein (TIGR03943 family)
LAKLFQSRWRGILLSLIGIVAILWLAVTDQLGLYIHPRYFVFTIVMAVIAIVFVLLAFTLPASDTTAVDGDPHDHDHDHAHDHDAPPATDRRTRWWATASLVLVLVTAVAMLVLPPAVLTTATVEQRDINGSVNGGDPLDTVDLAGGDYTTFTVKDWAGLLRQGAGESFFTGKTPTVVGFITPDADDPENVFYVARFVVTCCAVDAQPIGVPVYLPGWHNEYDNDDWVSVTGTFIANPSIDSMQAVVLTPTDIAPTDRPNQPYVY